MTAFADSSALVKLYVSEIGHLLVRSAGPLVISGLARVEVPAALWRKARSGEVSINDARTLVTEFEFDYVGSSYSSPRFLAILNVGSRLLDEAALLSVRHGSELMTLSSWGRLWPPRRGGRHRHDGRIRR